jgi:hypothetical protein
MFFFHLSFFPLLFLGTMKDDDEDPHQPVMTNGRAPDGSRLDALIFFGMFFFTSTFFFYSTDNFLATTTDNDERQCQRQ